MANLELAGAHFKNLLRPVYRKVKSGLGSRFAKPISVEGFFADTPVDLRKLTYFRRELFPEAGPAHWLDQPDALERINERVQAKRLSPEMASLCQSWTKNGFAILDRFFSPDRLDGIWESYERGIADKVITPEPKGHGGYWGRLLNPHHKIPALAELLEDSGIRRHLQVLMEREVTPFQTISAHAGSEQKTHSDAIHMTTYPLGYMTAAWVAFEDIHEDSGPLVYYPGSHRLPYYLSQAAGISPGEYHRLGNRVYSDKYEPFVERLVQREKLKSERFFAKKGDVFLWHHNLLHGGSPRKNVTLSRKSVVCHYFVKGAVCYHDLSGGLATIG